MNFLGLREQNDFGSNAYARAISYCYQVSPAKVGIQVHSQSKGLNRDQSAIVL